ncbi:MAG: antitoxin family protein [Planctomycetes bacterium]|nr:antitoxin family protein [Planctomycetota bacterium]
MKAVHAIYENGVFRPLVDVDLPDQLEVEFVPRPVSQETNGSPQNVVYDILSQSFDSGEPDLASRHDEHQP